MSLESMLEAKIVNQAVFSKIVSKVPFTGVDEHCDDIKCLRFKFLKKIENGMNIQGFAYEL